MLFNHEGRPVPQVSFRIVTAVGWYELSTADFFEHKTVVAFAVPGAFTCPHSLGRTHTFLNNYQTED
ncbi:hypothetical protein [Leptothoe sp. PORK10 BA2]|uniref:hypothetical protein n=1 Tax=Leptothoe sp. PORK10 BA2 TaxID=3110254 RepID=UPI002B1E9E35|nr:hypothetical protein [Leptothoe sp. PORK10 BA2]MEA5464320.1 hypothetical protein [Leptothoe sp. PORK10 BA2]